MSQKLDLKEWKRCRELGYKHFHLGQNLTEAEEQEFRELDAKFANFDGVAVVIERLEKAEAALRFYADESSWVSRSGKIGTAPVWISDWEARANGAGGVRARKYFAQFDLEVKA